MFRIFKKLIISLPIFLLLSANAFPQDGELWKVNIKNWSGGQHSFSISNVIDPTQGTSVKNVTLNRKGRLGKRKGATLFAQDLSNTAWTGVGRFTPTPTNDYIIAASGIRVLRSTSAASWQVINYGLGKNLSDGYNTEFIQCNDLLAVLNGVDYPAWYDGVEFLKGTAGSTSPPIAKYGSWFKNYLFLAHGASEKDWVWFSNNLTPKIFTETDVFKVNTGDGQAVQALKPFKENEMIIYKERSTWVLDITGATPLDDWTLQPVLEDIGLIAPRSVVSVGNDQWFLSSEPIGVRSLIRTDFDKIKTSLISTNIQDIFDGTGEIVINRTHINKAAGVFFDNKFLLAVASDTSTINDLVLVYDAIVDAWYLITGWYVADWQVFDNKLYFIDSSDGRAFRAFYGNNDQASGPVTTLTPATSPTVRGVDWHFESKAFDFDSPELYKLLDSMEVITESTGNHTMTVYVNLDGGGWQEVGTMTLTGTDSNLPTNVPFTLSSNTLARKVFPMHKFGKFREFQIGFDQSASDEDVQLREVNIIGKKLPWQRYP